MLTGHLATQGHVGVMQYKCVSVLERVLVARDKALPAGAFHTGAGGQGLANMLGGSGDDAIVDALWFGAKI